MNLIDYLKREGDWNAAQKLQVRERTISSWRLGHRNPSVRQAKDIERRTNGEVSFSECYENVE